MNLTITLTLITKSNFTLSYSNKTHSSKLTFDIFRLNKNVILKVISLKDLILKDIFLKEFLPKVKSNTRVRVEEGPRLL